ncbi:MAG: reverse transcriptase/maturase family protein [Alphaproteobacteria bacterium]|nr:reverse transcriptase/maturase family protein [Alphaproteobacteria bacterium]
MKTHKHLWSQFISPENFELAAHKALLGKKSKYSAKRFLRRRDVKLKQLRDALENGTFKTGRYRIFTIYEPKQRNIYMLPLYPDHIVHHALMNVLAPIWQKIFIHDSFACIPGRGLHAASHRCAEMVRKNKYVLQCDIRKFYPSINHDTMIRIIKRKISDRRILGLLENIVRSMPPPRGMPIGNLTSQWLGNLYMNELDMFVKHQMHVRNYIRYCDDFCIFSNDLHELLQLRKVLGEWLEQNLGLRFSRAFVKHTSHGVDFIGYRHFATHIILTHAGARKLRHNMRNIIARAEISRHTESQLDSYRGWMQWARCHNLRRKFRNMAEQTTPEFSRFFNRHIN